MSKKTSSVKLLERIGQIMAGRCHMEVNPDQRKVVVDLMNDLYLLVSEETLKHYQFKALEMSFNAKLRELEPLMSYKVEVIADSSGKWAGNDIQYATAERAEEAAKDLFFRWTSVRHWRVIDAEGYQVRQSKDAPTVLGDIDTRLGKDFNK